MAAGYGTQRIDCDVLIVGGGLAALVAAIEARKSVERVVVVSKRKVGRSGNTLVAGAQFSAYIPCEEIADSVEQHFNDTVEGGDGINDPALARTLVSEAEQAVLGLEDYGLVLHRVDGSLVRRIPPGHSRPRNIGPDLHGYSHGGRGLSMTLPLLKTALERGVTILSDMPVHQLLISDGQSCGALAFDTSVHSWVHLSSKTVVLTAGGGGRLFANTNNTREMTGDSYALALEAGLALRDMEFVQFIPTYMMSPVRAHVSTPLFGEGAVLRNRHGERFLARYDAAGDMATRDVMSKASFMEIQAGNGVEGGVYMDLSAVPLPVLDRKYPTVLGILRRHGVDPAKDYVVVSPATHFVMGGAWIDPDCRTAMDGLFVAGEAAGGVHGANRLGGNAFTETAVFGRRAGLEAAAHAKNVRRVPEAQVTIPEGPVGRSSGVSISEVKARLRQVMWDHASIVRTGAGLEAASVALCECSDTLAACPVDGPAELMAYLELKRMVAAAECIVEAALARKESRGAHFRQDYPARDDAHWLCSSRIEKTDAGLEVSFVPL